MLSVFLDCQFLIAYSIFSNVYSLIRIPNISVFLDCQFLIASSIFSNVYSLIRIPNIQWYRQWLFITVTFVIVFSFIFPLVAPIYNFCNVSQWLCGKRMSIIIESYMIVKARLQFVHPYLLCLFQAMTLVSKVICVFSELKEEFEDTKGVIGIRKSKKNKQHNGLKKKYNRTNNTMD